jgi:hypothetical protein
MKSLLVPRRQYTAFPNTALHRTSRDLREKKKNVFFSVHNFQDKRKERIVV